METGKTVGVIGLDVYLRLRVQCILLEERIRYIRIRIKGDGVLLEMVYLG